MLRCVVIFITFIPFHDLTLLSIMSLLCSCNIGPPPMLSPLLAALSSALVPQAINASPDAAGKRMSSLLNQHNHVHRHLSSYTWLAHPYCFPNPPLQLLLMFSCLPLMDAPGAAASGAHIAFSSISLQIHLERLFQVCGCLLFWFHLRTQRDKRWS